MALYYLAHTNGQNRTVFYAFLRKFLVKMWLNVILIINILPNDRIELIYNDQENETKCNELTETINKDTIFWGKPIEMRFNRFFLLTFLASLSKIISND